TTSVPDPSPKWSARIASAKAYASVNRAASTPRAPVVSHPEAYRWRSTRSVPSSTCPQSVRMPQSRIQHGYDKVGGQERRGAGVAPVGTACEYVNPRQMRWLRAWARWWVELRRPNGCQSRKGALLQELEDPLRPCSSSWGP
ncbi:hypothetical protein BC826DRAFT_1032992, partial [Russula brevipes]